MAFLSWLMSRGFSLDKIAPAMTSLGDAGTLAQLYAELTVDRASEAWPAFQAAIRGLGGPQAVFNDDPFGALRRPEQIAHLVPDNVELAGKVFAIILAGITEGKSESEIVASVRAVLGPMATTSKTVPSRKSYPLVLSDETA